MKEKMLAILSVLRLKLKQLIFRIAFIVVDFVSNLLTSLLLKCFDFIRFYHSRFSDHNCEFEPDENFFEGVSNDGL